MADLRFDGRVAVLTPTKNTRAEDFDLLEEFWQALGAVVVQMPPDAQAVLVVVRDHGRQIIARPALRADDLLRQRGFSVFRAAGKKIVHTVKLSLSRISVR